MNSQVKPTPTIGRYILNLPLVQVDSIGAGTGSFVRIDPNSGRPELGPDSAGAKIGVCWADGGLEVPSVTDLNLVLGRVNPDYFRQLNDLEVYAPHQSIEEPEHVEALIAAFEDAYGKLYARSASSPELGYLVTDVIVTGSVPVEKPALPEDAPSDGTAGPKQTRPVWWRDGFTDTAIYEQDDIRAGQTLAGPAIVESPADTFAIPPGRSARLDANRVFHLGGS